jgi:hypothetical protein
MENIKRLPLLLDMDGMLCAAGVREAKSLLSTMVSTFEGAVCINTAQSIEYLTKAGGSCVLCRSYELGLNIVNGDSTYSFYPPPEFGAILKRVDGWISARNGANLSIVKKSGGFGVKFR